MIKTFTLFFITAYFEILGCYSVLQYVKTFRQSGSSAIALITAIISLSIFAWLLTLHPTESGRVYAAYGGVYVLTSLLWLWLIDGVHPTVSDISGVVLILLGSLLIMKQ
jgi:small multidrug resistance family-3 protein